MTAWEKVEIARNPKRKTSLDYIDEIFDEFMELHGDRNFKDDKAIVCWITLLPANPIIAPGSAKTISAILAKDAVTPP